MKLVDDYQYPIKGSEEYSYKLDFGMQVAFIDGQIIMWPQGKTIDDVRTRRRLVQIEWLSRTSLDP